MKSDPISPTAGQVTDHGSLSTRNDVDLIDFNPCQIQQPTHARSRTYALS